MTQYLCVNFTEEGFDDSNSEYWWIFMTVSLTMSMCLKQLMTRITVVNQIIQMQTEYSVRTDDKNLTVDHCAQCAHLQDSDCCMYCDDQIVFGKCQLLSSFLKVR